ncbi:MAG TPA: DEAD/DEAH box helicase [Candidatus Polarisedimenticolia bacterium]|nr:DEAD/DEAH box helicase [Candidatus Polarisedimenticolia bacterium]
MTTMPLEEFLPPVRRWFQERLGVPSPPQVQGWPLIRAGRHTLIAAPTGTGKTLAAFLWAIDGLLRQGDLLPDETGVVYVSPLKALGNDVQKNLEAPLAAIRAIDPSLPEVRVMVRSGDTLASARAAMARRPPHILVTTPESLSILLTSAGGRRMLAPVRTVIVDEIHAVSADKRGAHLSLSLERLDALAEGPLQRIGLSATQKPIDQVGRLLAGAGRDVALVDVGHRREIDLGIEVPGSPLETVCSHETWEEIHARMAELIAAHRTTLVFVNTRKMAERVAARLTGKLGQGLVTSHHGSLSRDRRLDAERRLKQGELKALVATASLELGIDVGDVDLVIQAGVTSSIAMLLQRIGRSGHALSRVPKGRIFPLTQDELVCAAALLDAVRRGELDRTPDPGSPLDILAQQIVSECAARTWPEQELFAVFTRAWPYRGLDRAAFDQVVALHTQGRFALLHRDGVHGRLRATRRARLTALTSGGAIPDTADYKVVLEPEGTPVGSVHEDFAVEASAGDVFQLGNASWQVLKVEPGILRVADAGGAPPSLPFWLGEAPSRTRELSAAVSRLRERGHEESYLTQELGLPPSASGQLAAYVREGTAALGTVPTQSRVVVERFFDESGGMQMVLHSPFGGRINRAWGLALRKRICRGFGFELQAAANEEAIVISLGPQHSFEVEEIFDYLHPATARELLVQAVLPTPVFATRWRWNVTRSLMVPRTRDGGRRLPAPLLRMRADDALVKAFPQAMACGETLPPGDIPVPMEHPIVRQTIHDCLSEAMDADGLLEVLRGLRDGTVARIAVDLPEPSPFARGILNAMPYAFLDDAPLEERRTQAVMSRRGLDPRAADSLGALDPAAVERVRMEAWPQPEDAEELHEALLWMGYATAAEAAASGWGGWLEELRSDRRAALEEGRWFASEAPRDPRETARGRLEALGPVAEGSSALRPEEAEVLPALEREGAILRCRLDGARAWCERRLLARIHRQTLEKLRREIEPVSAAAFWRFLGCWQHADDEFRLEGPRGVAVVVSRLAGFEAPASSWESALLPSRVRGYRPDWLDQLTLSGEAAWGRLWGAGNPPVRSIPLSLVPRLDLDEWLALAGPAGDDAGLSTHARAVLGALEARGALFHHEIVRAAGGLESHAEMGLAELIGQGRVTCDSFAGLRRLLRPASRRSSRHGSRHAAAGRWSLLRTAGHEAAAGPDRAAFAARRLLTRYGVIFRRLLERERLPVPWRDLLRALRHMELTGEARGGRFVARFSGEQYGLPEAVELLRRLRRREAMAPMAVAAADPLNLRGILTPDPRVAAQSRRRVAVGG